MTGALADRTTGLGPCWFESCDASGTEVIQGVPVAPQGTSRDVVDAASRITKVGLIVCSDHAPLARRLAGL